MVQIGIVIKETYRRQVKSWSFLLMVLSPFIFLLLSFGVGYLSSTMAGSKEDRVAVVTADSRLKKQLTVDKTNTTAKYPTVTAAKKALISKKIKGYLKVENMNGKLTAAYFGVEHLSETQHDRFLQILSAQQQIMNLKKAQLSQNQLLTLRTQPQLKQTVSDNNQNAQSAVKLVSFMALLFIMYFILLTYTTTVAQEIASEKGTKIMEMIFSSMPAKNYFYGKILGTFGVIATHLAIYLIGGMSLYFVSPHFEFTKSIFNENKETVDKVVANLSNLNLLYVLLGVIIFTVLAALCGSLVVRPEDTSKAIQPVMYLVMAGFFGALILGQSADNVIVKVASFIPFLSSFFMPIRLINGNTDTFQVVISLIILLASTVGLTVYVGSLYAGLILQTDDVGLIKSFRRGLKIK
ncbi:ABC transporter permease [Liquorilactobacillus oeni]|uniref:ABC transporter, permease n=1 Tax=Liquorilactobacillus oeni DSM 19972 TaxID=1423777 RepID=A0A0R1MCU7_9LACO|nr:ABC transporter permease [Liquorilactobacillus oeni]KRL05625.1 ABC transporter, permease [Liquorilactobacillus oeni DSM 19972]